MLFGFALGFAACVGLEMIVALLGCWAVVVLDAKDSEKASMIKAAHERQGEAAEMRRQINKLGGFA